MISVGEFVSRLFAIRRSQSQNPAADCQEADLTPQLTLPELLRYGHFRGWLEDSDERQPQAPLNRQTAVRITHQFMLIELKIPDLADISPAAKLKDLYTCRVCTNHIAQLYTRGIMGTKKEEPDLADSSALFFDHLQLMTKEEVSVLLEKLLQLIS